MPEASKSPRDRIKLFTAFLVVGVISLVQPGCNCSSSNDGSTAPPPAVSSVSPPSSSATALVTADVTAVFLNEMDAESVASAFTLTVNSNPVAATVSYDDATKTATLTPDTDLTSGTEYRATIASSVKDINGESPLSSDFIWSFTASPAMQLSSKNANGVTSNDVSRVADIDATGRYIVFESDASNLTSIATTLNRSHIYRKDTVTGDVILVSSDSDGLEANNGSSNPSISTNGSYVVFESTATNLDAAITSPGTSQIYLKNIENGSVDLVSRSAVLKEPDNSFNSATNAHVSDDGLLIVFESAATNLVTDISSGGVHQIYLKNMSDESVEMISQQDASTAGNDASTNPDMSADGIHIVFESSATNFPASIGFNHIYYVNTSVAHKLEQISVASGGAEANSDSNRPSISNDGSTVVFHSKATNLAGLDNNGVADVFLHYITPGSTELISANPNTGESGDSASSNAHISGNAVYVVFESLASDLAIGSTSNVSDILVRDLSVLPEIIIEKLDNPSFNRDSNGPVISTDGRYVSFDSMEKYADDTDTLSDVFRAHNSAHP